jgi:hypothetical protein
VKDVIHKSATERESVCSVRRLLVRLLTVKTSKSGRVEWKRCRPVIPPTQALRYE